jgi:starch-binding outer membrane protein, SusD/RagB family
MKKAKYILILPGVALLMLGIQACKKSFLDKAPLGSISQQTLANKAGVQGLLIGAYAMLRGHADWGSAPSNWTYGSVAGGDAYKGSTPSDQYSEGAGTIADYSYNSTNGYLPQKWSAVYAGAQRANDVIRIMALAADVPADEQTEMTAEARFLRGYYHLEAKQIWKYPPYVDENVTQANGNLAVPNIDASGNFIDIWPKIDSDFLFAMANLPETQPQRGRANKWAAMAFLVKSYMFQDRYADAKPLLDQLITSGKTAGGQPYALQNFASNFNGAQDNGPESVFAVQYSVQDGSGTNGRYGDNLGMPNGGVYGCCGFFNPSQTLANAFKTGADGLPLLDTYNSGSNVGYFTSAGALNAGAYTGSLDPRIDWTMGRPGLPYYDDGLVPSTPDFKWIRDPSTDGVFSPKKNVYAASQSTTIASTETSFWGPTQMTAQNYDIIRYAEVLLWGAETEVAVGDPAKALDYVNQIRNRAADPKGWVYKNSVYDPGTATYKVGTPADNYVVKPYPAGAFADKVFAMKAIMHESQIELAMEGHRFFDLQRWDNGTGLMATVINAYINAEKSRPSYFSVHPEATFEKGKDEYYPIPQNQIDVENSTGTVLLKQDPAYQ